MLTQIGTNAAKCAEYAIKLPEFVTESLDFGQIWTQIIAELRKHDFPRGIHGCAGALSGLFSRILLCIPIVIRMDSERYTGILGRFGSIHVIRVYLAG